MADDDIYKDEREFFESMRRYLLENYHKGKFALIKGKKLLGTFDTFENAYVAGFRELGNVPMYIKEVLEQDRVLWVNHVGVVDRAY